MAITRILGIDPGSTRLGLGLIEKQGNQMRLLFAEVIAPPAKHDFYDRLRFISLRIKELIDELNPDEIAVEDIFHSKNARSALHLGIARGVAITAGLNRNIKIYEYAPTKVKSVVTGDGRADKSQVKKMVGLTLGPSKGFEALGFDATDAIAVAICHASTTRILSALTQC